jgi:peptidoglycan/LPS O-acetylase OafA/YrhL
VALLARGSNIRTLLPYARVAGPVAIAGVVLIAFGADGFEYDLPLIYTIGFSLLATSFASLLIVSVAKPDSPWSRGLVHPFFRFFGKYSYGLYVAHTPIFTALFHTNGGQASLQAAGLWSPIPAVAVAMSVTLAVVLVSWNVLEKPMLGLKRYFETAADVPAETERRTASAIPAVSLTAAQGAVTQQR